jgi:hypothetical protein
MAELYFYYVVLALAGVVATVTRGGQPETQLGAGSHYISQLPVVMRHPLYRHEAIGTIECAQGSSL